MSRLLSHKREGSRKIITSYIETIYMKTRLNALSVNCNVRECRSGNFESFLIITQQDMLHYVTKYLQLLKLNMANYSTIDCSGKGKSSTTINVSPLWCPLDDLDSLQWSLR